jgi:hypothetical protein
MKDRSPPPLPMPRERQVAAPGRGGNPSGTMGRGLVVVGVVGPAALLYPLSPTRGGADKRPTHHL